MLLIDGRLGNAGKDAREVRMDAQWLMLGLALAWIALTVTSLVSPNGLVRGNLAWFACGWLGTELAAWLAAAAAALAIAFAASNALDAEPGRLAVLLLVASAGGLVAVFVRARQSAGVMEKGLEEALGPGYSDEIAALRRSELAQCRLHRLQPVPLRPRSVELLPDVPYPGGHALNSLDVYRRASGCRDAPVLLHIHGGGWTGGHKRQQAMPLLHHLASLGWIVVSTNYRLSPEARLPAHLVDCKSAFAWIRAHAASLGGDPSFVAVTGGGAGAHLAALLALTFRNEELQPGFEHVDTRPSACVALHGLYDLADRGQRQPRRRARLRWLGTNLMPCEFERDPAAWDLASPTRLVREDAPPFMVLHGTHDSLHHVAEAREFADRLRSVSSNPVVYAELPGAPHAWDSLCSPRTADTVQAVTQFLEWCAARHFCTRGPQRDSADRARS